jgi:hypothetical protein
LLVHLLVRRRASLFSTSPYSEIQRLVSIDFMTIPTATFRVLYVFIVLAHDQRLVSIFV